MFDAVRSLQPAELLAAWRREPRLLEIDSAVRPLLRDRAEIRIEVAGKSAHAVIVGAVAGVRREGAHFRVEIAPEVSSLPAVARLLDAAGADPARHLPRHPPRYAVRLPATVTFRDASTVAVTAESVSEGGCRLAWSGPPPPVGEVLRLRVPAAGGEDAENAGTICWRAVSPRASVGVQFAGRRAPGRWAALVAALAKDAGPRQRAR